VLRNASDDCLALAWIWAPMPLILSAFAISHVWRGTATPVAA